MPTSILALISTLFIVTSAALVGVGWYSIREGNRPAHRLAMKAAAAFAVLFLVSYLLRTLVIGNTAFGGPTHLKPFYIGFLIFHICLAVTGLTLGALTITCAVKGRLELHKRLGPWTSVIWFCSAATGIFVYLSLYVIWEPGPTVSMMKAILGR
jgi:putative membrane protein